MAFHIQIEHKSRTVHIRFLGDVSALELHACNEQLRERFSKHCIDATWTQLTDLRDAIYLPDVTLETIYGLTERSPWPRNSFRVIVASTDQTFGISRMYQSLSGQLGTTLVVVRSIEEGRALIAQRKSAD